MQTHLFLSMTEIQLPSPPALTLAHNSYFEALIQKEYGRLASEGHTYLDYTGGNLYAQSHLQKHQELLQGSIFGNPHSTNPTSQLSTKHVESARQKVIDFFNAEDYFCVFTQNASGALKIVGECYPFEQNGHLLMLTDNHNSVNGIREFCKNGGAEFEYAPIQYEDLEIDPDSLNGYLTSQPDKTNKLFAFPAQSNVSGVKHDLDWIQTAQDHGWDVLLDAAAFVPTSKLDLSIYKPDFVSVSFYKIFGYPTGIGCLLIKKESFQTLRKPWFAGGTVTMAANTFPHHYLAENHERFEDGTINYLDIPAVGMGLDFINSIGIERIQERVNSLVVYLFEELKKLTHSNGQPIVKTFGPSERRGTGGTIIMNFLDESGATYPFHELEAAANERMISTRYGCFCNPGIDEINYAVTGEEMAAYFSSRDRGDFHDMVAFLKKMRGATRVSVGIATSKADLDTFIEFIKAYVSQASAQQPEEEIITASQPEPTEALVRKFVPFSINE